MKGHLRRYLFGVSFRQLSKDGWIQQRSLWQQGKYWVMDTLTKTTTSIIFFFISMIRYAHWKPKHLMFPKHCGTGKSISLGLPSTPAAWSSTPLFISDSFQLLLMSAHLLSWIFYSQDDCNNSKGAQPASQPLCKALQFGCAQFFSSRCTYQSSH